MSDESDESDDDSGAVEQVLRTVTAPSRMHENREMSVIGWVIFVVLLVIAVPLIPLYVVFWVVNKAVEATTRSPERS